MLVELNEVTVRFGAVDVLRTLSLTVAHNGLVAVTGPSGSGKSTLLLALAGEVDLAEGERLTRGDVRFGWVHQFAPALKQRSVVDNVAIGAWSRGLSTDAGRAAATDALGELGIDHLAGRVAGVLSGGELQRVVVARLLASDVDVVLADEPTASLDRANAAVVADALARLGQHRPVIIATHDLAVAASADRTIRLVDGRLDPA